MKRVQHDRPVAWPSTRREKTSSPREGAVAGACEVIVHYRASHLADVQTVVRARSVSAFADFFLLKAVKLGPRGVSSGRTARTCCCLLRMDHREYFGGAGDGACSRPTGLAAAPPNRPLHEREVLRLDCEPDDRVRKLTGFASGAEMRKVFLELGLDELLRHLPRDRRTYERERFDDAFDRLKKKGYVPAESFDRCRKSFERGEYKFSFDEIDRDDVHHSRVPDINIFGLVCVIVFGGLDFGSAACLPYFNLSEQQTALLFNNAVRVVAAAMSEVWAPRVRSRKWLEENCRPPMLVETESECEDDAFDDDDGEPHVPTAHEARRAIYRSDMVFLIDGMDRKCERSTNMLDQAEEYGVKTKTLMFHGVRWSVVSNLAGHVVFRSRAVAHSVTETDLVVKGGFLDMLDKAFSGVETKRRVALVCDRGYFKLKVAELNKTLENIVLTLFRPTHLNTPYEKTEVVRTQQRADNAELNIMVASIRSINENTNLHVVQCKFYDHTIPLALMHALDDIDGVADSMANFRAGAEPECLAKRRKVH